MADSLTTKFENALIELIGQYVDDGLNNADIRGVLDARRDDDHEYRDNSIAGECCGGALPAQGESPAPIHNPMDKIIPKG